MKLLSRLVFPILLAGAFASADDLRVSAAASLAETMNEIGTLYQKENGVKLELNLGGSNVLARQIEEGAPVDVFISADERTMDGLKTKGALLDDSVTPLLANSLVVIVPGDSGLVIGKASDLATPKIRRLALGDPAAVPAGVYAKAWLERQGVWDSVGGKVVGMENVRGALAAVEGGDADAGVVYRTDAAISKKVKVALFVPSAECPPILYPAAVCRSSKQATEARRFIAWLQRKEIAAVFEKHGFIALPPQPAK